MRSWVEGLLAIGVILVLGAGLFLFTGESLGSSNSETAAPIEFDPEAAARGQVVAESTGCLQCHTIDGTPSSGSTWLGLAGSNRLLTTGETVVADDTYLFNSIVDPPLQLVEGFDPIMQTGYGDTLSIQEIDELIDYIKSLS